MPDNPVGTPPAEVRIDTALVRPLVRTQFPQYASRRLQPMGSGWDNVMMRLGTDLLVRLPRRAIAAVLIEEEQRWLPELSSRLPIDVPVPIHIGRPSKDYPWPWSIVRWLPGEGADRSPPSADQGCRLASFLSCLHQAAPEGVRVNPVRGVPLATRSDQVGERMERLARTTDAITPRVRTAWHEALAAAPSTERLWLHGDLHPLNILVWRGRITGVVDWGDLTAGDVATDLAVFWMLFDEPARERALAAYGHVDNAMRARAMGWAILFGAILLDTGLVDHPRHAAVGAAILRRVAQNNGP
ncbi:MAG: aminoglycoside phosphotransferase family protein [Gammaproteobacteria bacterium]|nr:aminoglycoside phosphotransferase family protein [Gammaproteobacteria bacterium]